MIERTYHEPNYLDHTPDGDHLVAEDNFRLDEIVRLIVRVKHDLPSGIRLRIECTVSQDSSNLS